MGVNIMLYFEVRGLAGAEERAEVCEALDHFLRVEEGLQPHEVGLGWSVDEDGEQWISGETDYPIGISSFYAWRPRFEKSFTERVHAIAPAAVPTINWNQIDGG